MFLGLPGSWDEQSFCNVPCALLAYTIPFVAHYYQAVVFQFFSVDVVTVKECSIYRCLIFDRGYEGGQVDIVYLYTCNCSHCSLDGLWIVYVGSSNRTEDIFNSKPVGNAHYRAKIAGVLHVVQRKAQFVLWRRKIGVVLWLVKDSKHALRGLLETNLFHLAIANFYDFISRLQFMLL